MNDLPEKLNNQLIAISLVAVGYGAFEWHRGGGLIWRFVVGLFGYFLLAGIWQAFRKKSR